jgi:hypothetical protein
MNCPVCNSILNLSRYNKTEICYGNMEPFYHEFNMHGVDDWSLYTNKYKVFCNEPQNYYKLIVYHKETQEEIDLLKPIPLDNLLNKIQLLLTFS